MEVKSKVEPFSPSMESSYFFSSVSRDFITLVHLQKLPGFLFGPQRIGGLSDRIRKGLGSSDPLWRLSGPLSRLQSFYGPLTRLQRLFGLQFGNRGFQPFCRLPWTFFGSSIWPLWPVGVNRHESMVLKLDDISTCLQSLDGPLPLSFALQSQPARLSGIPGFSTCLHRTQVSSIWTI